MKYITTKQKNINKIVLPRNSLNVFTNVHLFGIADQKTASVFCICLKVKNIPGINMQKKLIVLKNWRT